MSAQRELIQKLAKDGVIEAVELRTPTSSPLPSPTRPSRQVPATDATLLSNRLRDITLNGPTNTIKRSNSPLSMWIGDPAPPPPPTRQELGFFGSPEPLPTPSSMSSGSRKMRRQTIESDLDALAQEKPVERTKSILLTPRKAVAKQRRVLSGMAARQAASMGENAARGLEGVDEGNSSESGLGRQGSVDRRKLYI